MRARTAADVRPLSAGVVAILLSGWGAARDVSDCDGAFELFQGNLPEAARLWRQHESFLRAEAQRLGVAPEHGYENAPVFFGEYANWSEAARRAHGDDENARVGELLRAHRRRDDTAGDRQACG